MIELTHKDQAQLLLDMFGGSEDEVSILVTVETYGHSGPGIYAHYTDYPDEGSICVRTLEVPKSPATHELHTYLTGNKG